MCITKGFHTMILSKDMARLNLDCKLNDEIVNYYFSLLERHSNRREFPMYFFQTYFYTKLTSTPATKGPPGSGRDGKPLRSKVYGRYMADCNHAAVRRWTKKVDLFRYRLILIPVHEGDHWILVVVRIDQNDDKKKTFRIHIGVYDSLGTHNAKHVKVIKSYLQLEYYFHHGDYKKWIPRAHIKGDAKVDVPQQSNGFDCGVHVCASAYNLAHHVRSTSHLKSQQDMNEFRNIWR